MKTAKVKFQILTPCICTGYDQRRAEIRAPSIRGQLRWWFRALGGQLSEEKAIFGGVHHRAQASSLVTRVTAVRGPTSCQNLADLGWREDDPRAYLLWPLRPTHHSDQKRGFLEPRDGNTPSFELQISHRLIRGGAELPDRVLEAFALLGALGTRSRRAFGSIWPTGMLLDGSPERLPQTVPELEAKLRSVLDGTGLRVLALAFGLGSWEDALACCGEFLRTFRCGKGVGVSEWGRSDHDAPFKDEKKAYRAVIGLPLAQRYGHGSTVIRTRHGHERRWASPLLLKVVSLDEGVVPLAVFVPCLALPEGSRIHLVEEKQLLKSLTASHGLFRAMMEPDSRYWSHARVLVP